MNVSIKTLGNTFFGVQFKFNILNYFVTKHDFRSHIYRKNLGRKYVKDFETIYMEYHPQVFHYLYRLCNNEEIAEELTQETFYRALKNVDKFRGECKISTWLCQIAKNCFFSYKKKHKLTDIISEKLVEEEKIYEKSSEEAFLSKEEYLRIHTILDKLDEPYREIFCMRAINGLSFSQIATLHHKSESWARVTYHRAKIKIKEELR